MKGLCKWLEVAELRSKQYLASLRFNRANVAAFLEYLVHLRNLVLDDEDDEHPADYSSQSRGTQRVFAAIKAELLERIKFMRNIYSFLNDEHANFILLEHVDLESIDEAELERMDITQNDFSDLEKIQEAVKRTRQESLQTERGSVTRTGPGADGHAHHGTREAAIRPHRQKRAGSGPAPTGRHGGRALGRIRASVRVPLQIFRGAQNVQSELLCAGSEEPDR